MLYCKLYLQINYDGDKLILSPQEACEHLINLGEDVVNVTFESVYMTKKQFESLPEFQG
jgi:hypothetical protein